MKRLWLVALLAGYALLGASTLAGERGLLYLWKLQEEQQELQAEVFTLLRGNEDLRHRIERLQTDDEFFEKVARETLRLTKKGEVVYLFQEAPGASTP
jgi:cell division protein FtsB